MKSISKALVVVAALALAGIAAASASAASAGAGDCTYVGSATVNAAPVDWVGGAGAFGFQGTAVCAGVVASSTPSGTPVAETAVLAASGTYASLVCGTSNPGVPSTTVGNVTITNPGTKDPFVGVVPLGGAATGTATLSPATPAPGTTASFTGSGPFVIPFVGGQGITAGTFTATSNTGVSFSGPQVGYVTIFPDGSQQLVDAVNTIRPGTLPNTDPVTGGGWNGSGTPPAGPPNPTALGFGTCVDHYSVVGSFAVAGTA